MKTIRHLVAILAIVIFAGSVSAQTQSADDAGQPAIYMVTVDASESPYYRSVGEIVALNSVAAEYAQDDFESTFRQGFQQVHPPKFIFSTRNNRFSLGIGGYINLRTSYDFKGAVNNIDFIPYDIPMTTTYSNRQRVMMDATTSRLFTKAVINTSTIGQITTFVDMDFRGGEEFSYTPRLRSAYVSLLGFTAGRDVTTFCDLTAAPTTIDFQGPNAYNFNFATMIRYEMAFLDNHMKFGVAAEMPNVSGTYGQTFMSVPQRVPDFPLYLQYMWGKHRQSHIRASAVLRNMYLYNDARKTTTDLFGWGAQLSGNIHITKMIQLFMNGVYGQGITPYIQDLTGAGLDFTPNPQDPTRIQTMPMFGWQAAAQINILPNLFVSGGYSMVQVQHKNGFYADNQYRRGQYIFGNIFYSLTPRFKIAAEYLWASRKNMNSDENHANRINLLFKYSF